MNLISEVSCRREILDEYLEWFSGIAEVPVTHLFVDNAEYSRAGALRYTIHLGGQQCITDGWHRAEEDPVRYYHTHNGYLHSTDDNPSFIYTSGTDITVSWDHLGLCHRSHGPAVISCRKDAAFASWYWHGASLSLDKWLMKSDLPDSEKVHLKMVWG